MMQLLYYYGGMTLPNSFLCMKNLKEFYDNGISNGKPFVCENVNHTTNLVEEKQKLLFSPDISIMGAAKNDPTILEFVEYLKTLYGNGHFSNEMEFLGKTSHWCKRKIDMNSMNLIGGEYIGVKSHKRKPILLENLMEEEFLDTIPNLFGIYIPREQILKRTKYQWFAVLSSEELLKSNAIIVKYLKASIVDSTDEYYKNSEIRSVVAI